MSERREFGQHVRSCRRTRGLTQESLALKSRLSAATVRNLESGSFSPSLDTLNKVCTGLEISLSTLFTAFDTIERSLEHEIYDLVSLMNSEEQLVVLRLLLVLRDFIAANTDSGSTSDGEA